MSFDEPTVTEGGTKLFCWSSLGFGIRADMEESGAVGSRAGLGRKIEFLRSKTLLCASIVLCCVFEFESS